MRRKGEDSAKPELAVGATRTMGDTDAKSSKLLLFLDLRRKCRLQSQHIAPHASATLYSDTALTAKPAATARAHATVPADTDETANADDTFPVAGAPAVMLVEVAVGKRAVAVPSVFVSTLSITCMIPLARGTFFLTIFAVVPPVDT